MKDEYYEWLLSAQYNLETFERQNPQIKSHISYFMAKSQIDNLLKKIKEEMENEDE